MATDGNDKAEDTVDAASEDLFLANSDKEKSCFPKEWHAFLFHQNSAEEGSTKIHQILHP